MGALESSEIDEYTPPPPSRSTVFVVRNGRYELQSLMPVLPRSTILDFDGFVGRRGNGAGCLTSRPPDMRQATLGKNLASIRRESMLLKPIQCGDAEGATLDWGLVSLSLVFDAVKPGTISLHLMVTEVEHKDQEPQRNPPVRSRIQLRPQQRNPETEVEPQEEEGKEREPSVADAEAMDVVHFQAGAGQVYNSPPIDLQQFPSDQLCFDLGRPRDIPLAVRVECDVNPEEEETSTKVLFTYVSLLPWQGGARPSSSQSNPWPCQIIAQKLQQDGSTYVLHEVFGVSSKHSVDGDCGNTECVICLSEPRDTAVLPCRHMCFCSYCAGIVRLQCDRCPVCRQRVHSLLQFKRDPAEEKAAMQLAAPVSSASGEATHASPSTNMADPKAA